jgi:23S rRNA (cytidine1920-2'-O)/16S rRNA (cytidine1409-2'-O)-methyltransferase
VSRSRARGLILAGRVRVDGSPHVKPGANVPEASDVVVDEPARFVSRGGEKLDAALEVFGLDVRGFDVLDVGASTGGFTDCLLSRGAAHVVALDVGYGQLAWKLRNDPRVTVIERANARTLPDDAFPQRFDLAVVDTSFISLRLVVPKAAQFVRAGAAIVALVKPQFEVGREHVGEGVVRDAGLHREVLRNVRDELAQSALVAVGLTVSPLRGPAGNIEFFYLLRREGAPVEDAAIDRTVAEAHAA